MRTSTCYNRPINVGKELMKLSKYKLDTMIKE